MKECPKCDGKVDGFMADKWGDGLQRERLAPFICSWCGSLLIMDLASLELIDPLRVQRETGIDAIAYMRANLPLWEAITERRQAILALPNRRPVLR